MKLCLGCGFRKKEGYVNVDKGDFCSPDVVCDLATSAWPWSDNSVSEVAFEFSLEQMGETNRELFHVLQELYRVCQSDARVTIVSLYPRHDQFLLNPLNTHRLSVEFFRMFSIQENLLQIGSGNSDNCLGLQYGVNFVMTDFRMLLSADIHAQMEAGTLREEEVRERMRYENNICQAMEIQLRAVKSDRG